ncbi:MAG: VCBS repeat-containing protein [Bacteroidia bacterium]
MRWYYNGFTEGMYILSAHTYLDTIESARTLVLDSAININQIELTDYDNDGDQDLIVASLSPGRIGVYSNEENLNFVLSDSLEINLGRIANMEMIDLNNDGHDDLVYSGALNSTTIHISVEVISKIISLHIRNK